MVALQPNDALAAQLLDKLQPPAATTSQAVDNGKLPGVWVAQASPRVMITLTIAGGGSFTWVVATAGKPPVSIGGAYAQAGGVLTLSGKDTPGGPLVAQVAMADDQQMTFKAIGAPSSDPALKFLR